MFFYMFLYMALRGLIRPLEALKGLIRPLEAFPYGALKGEALKGPIRPLRPIFKTL